MKRLLFSCLALLVASAPASSQTTVSKAGGGWRVSVERSPVDDSETVLLNLTSVAPFEDRFGRRKWASLTIGCVENSTIFSIWPGGEFVAANGEFGYVTFRIDKKKAERRFMSESTDNEWLGLWHGLGIDLIREIATGETLFVRITPYNEAPVDLTFSVGGLKKVLPKVQRACGWE